MFHTPVFLACTHLRRESLIWIVGGFEINARHKQKNKVDLDSSSTWILDTEAWGKLWMPLSLPLAAGSKACMWFTRWGEC